MSSIEGDILDKNVRGKHARQSYLLGSLCKGNESLQRAAIRGRQANCDHLAH